ncbi:MAG: ATP-binding protein [Pseudodonghicola sp.]
MNPPLKKTLPGRQPGTLTRFLKTLGLVACVVGLEPHDAAANTPPDMTTRTQGQDCPAKAGQTEFDTTDRAAGARRPGIEISSHPPHRDRLTDRSAPRPPVTAPPSSTTGATGRRHATLDALVSAPLLFRLNQYRSTDPATMNKETVLLRRSADQPSPDRITVPPTPPAILVQSAGGTVFGLDASAAFQLFAMVALAILLSASIASRVATSRAHAKLHTVSQVPALLSRSFHRSDRGLIVATLDGTILLANPAAHEIFGFKPDTLLHQKIENTIVPDQYADDYRILARRLQDKSQNRDINLGPHQYDIPRSGRNMRITATIRTETGGGEPALLMIYVAKIAKQTTVHKKLKENLRTLRDHTSARDKEFLTYNHEMRAPLHGIIAALDLIKNAKTTTEMNDLIETAKSCSQRALTQIDWSLEASRSGRQAELRTSFSPKKEAEALIREIELATQSNGNTIALETRGDAEDIECTGMPLTYSRALSNLITNANKFTRNGKITVRLKFHSPDGGRGGYLVTEVVDTGRGIPHSELGSIFDPYSQVLDATDPAEQAGFGLGLSIVHDAVQRMNGSIEVDSKPDTGTRFRFEIPLEFNRIIRKKHLAPERALPAHGQQPATPQRPPLVLVADDDRVCRSVITGMLKKLGCRVETTSSGANAIKLARARRFDFIFTDLNMPGLNGAVASRRIRQKGASRNAKVIGVTGQMDFFGSEAYFSAGMVAVLNKPFGIEQLADVLDRFSDPDPADAPARPDHVTSACTSDLSAQLESVLHLVGEDKGLRLVRDTLEFATSLVGDPSADSAHVRDIAHKAGGSASMLGLERLGQLLFDLEETATRSDDLRASSLLASIAEELRRTQAALDLISAKMTAPPA